MNRMVVHEAYDESLLTLRLSDDCKVDWMDVTRQRAGGLSYKDRDEESDV